MIEIIIATLIIWVACGVIVYGAVFAYSQREFPELADNDYNSDRKFAMQMGLTGVFGLLALILSGVTGEENYFKHGFKFI